MKKKIFIVGALVFGVLFIVGGVAHAGAVHYVSGRSSVDEREIRWDGGTTYRDQLNAAMNTWNARGRVTIAADTPLTYEDLRIYDVNQPDVPWVGQYRYSLLGTDEMILNRGHLLRATNAQRQNVATHELGHALGLAHSTLGNVMFDLMTSVIQLGPQDTSDYSFLWGN